MATAPWWKEAFGSDYQEVYGHRSDQDADSEVSGLLPRLSRLPGPVLDAGCGNGRHLAALRAAGIDAFGFDLSRDLLLHGHARAGCRGRLARCDMRHPGLAPGWGAVLLLFTAFGYFDDAENAGLLTVLAGLLADNGMLVLDLPDPDHLGRSLVKESRRQTDSGLEIVEQRALCGSRVDKTVTLIRAGLLVRRYTESVRLYTHDEIAQLARQGGLVLADRWPSLHGPLTDQHRQVYWLQRPAAMATVRS